MRRMFMVQVEMPEGATVEDMRAYIWDAVATWKGQLHPDEPIFDLDSDKVRVLSIPATTREVKTKS